MRLVLISIVLAISGLVASSLATASGPPSYTAEMSQGPMIHSSDGQATQETPAQAAAAASQPGSVVELGSAQTAAASGVCWHWDQSMMWTEWGTWPVQQRVGEDRHWCANYYGGIQTYRSTASWPDTYLCDWHDKYTSLIAGGNGTGHSRVRTGAYFNCPTPIPYWTQHYNRWQEWNCDMYGSCYWKAAS